MTEPVETDLRKTIAENLIHYRKQAGLTQQELSEQIHYSDKSISKWERGEGLPDVPTLVKLAEVFGVSPAALLESGESAQDVPQKPELPVESKHSTLSGANWKHFFVTLLAVSGVWLAAFLTICLFQYLAPSLAIQWNSRILCFALTGGFVTFLVFACLWWERAWIFIAISGIIWGAALSIYVTFSTRAGAAVVFDVASILQLATLLCYFWRCAVRRRWLIPYPLPK